MTQYRKRAINVTATQWNKPGDHASVSDRIPEIVFDRAGHYFYVSHCDRALPMGNAWLAVDPTSAVAVKNGAALPFAFYEVKSGERVPAVDRPELLDRYAADSQWPRLPVIAGVATVSSDPANNYIVNLGDWIVEEPSSGLRVCSPAVFAREYEAVESEAGAR